MDIQTTIKIAREYEDKFRETDAVIETRVAICISVDPIDNKKRVTVYTDDGFGNGNEILSFDAE